MRPDTILSRGLAVVVMFLALWGTAIASSKAPQNGPSGKALLWKIEKPGVKASYVLGTIHSEDPRVTAVPAPVTQALEKSDTFVMEVAPGPDLIAELGRAMFLPEGEDLKTLVGAELYTKATSALGQHGIPEAAVSRMKPWAVATTLSVPKPKTGLVLDLVLYQMAAQAGKGVQGLETAKEQFGPFEQLSIKEQVQMLRDTLTYLPDADRFFASLHRAYLDRDLNRLMAISDEYMRQGDQGVTQRLKKSLVDDRNQVMAERSRPLLEKGGAFIAVGALHLPGRLGVLNLIEKQGYRVTPVY